MWLIYAAPPAGVQWLPLLGRQLPLGSGAEGDCGVTVWSKGVKLHTTGSLSKSTWLPQILYIAPTGAQYLGGAPI